MIWRLSLILAAVCALAMPSSALAGRALDVSPTHVEFGEQPFHTFTTKAFTVENVGKKTIAVSVETGSVPDDFSPGQPESTCAPVGSTMLAGGQSCTYVVGFRPTPYFEGIETATVVLTARDQATGTLLVAGTVEITGRGV